MIVCGSDSEHTRSSSSQITSVDLRPELLAKIAVTTLVNRRDGLDRPLPTGEVRGRLIVRESTRHQTHNADLAVSCRELWPLIALNRPCWKALRPNRFGRHH